MTCWRRAIVIVSLLGALAFSASVPQTAAQEDCPGGSTSTSCSDNGNSSGGSCDGNGGSGSSGGGGGACEDIGGPDPTRRPAPPPTREPEPVVVPARRPVVPVRTAAPAVGTTTATTTNPGGPAATDAQLAAWARHFRTTPEEVKSWFDPYTPNDTIGGEGSGKSASQGEEYTISNNAAVRNGAAKAGSIDPRVGNTVEVSLHSMRVPLGTTTTEANGRFSITVRIPQSTKLGRHFVVALAPNTKGGSAAFVFPVEVTEPQPVFNGAVPQAARSPRSGPPWLIIEVILGLALVGGLIAARTRGLLPR